MTTPSDTPVDDHSLLDAYALHGDQTAFAELVRRHAGLVHGVCRRVLRDAHLADDAMQAAFLVLARKAGSLRREASLAGWLHRTAELCARGLQRERLRRQRREQEVATAQETAMPETPAVGAEVAAHLDEALAALPAGYRAVVVERVLCGRSEDETGSLLGLGRSAVSVRLARALALLRDRLARRGVAVPASALAALLAAEAAHAAPAATIAAAQTSAAGAASPLVLSTAENAMHALFWSTPKLVAVGLALAAGLLATVLGAMRITAGEAAPPAPVPVPAVAPTQPLAAIWAGRPLVKLADDACLPCWSPDGRRLAWVAVLGQREEDEREGRTGGGKPGGPGLPRRSATACTIGIADLASGAIASVELLRDAPPPLGLAWMGAGDTLLAWDEQRVWRIDGAAGAKPVAREPQAVGAGRIIGAVLPSPDGGRWLCACSSSAVERERLEDALLVFGAPGAPPVELAGRRPLWAPDGKALYFSHLDGVWAWSGAGPGGLRPVFTAAYYLTHPFPKPVTPPDGFRHEVWPLAVLEGGGLAVEVAEVQARSQGFGGHLWWPHRGEVVLWTPQGAMINDRLTDDFTAIGQTRSGQYGPTTSLHPLDGKGRFLRLEDNADDESKFGALGIGYRLRRLLAMTVDGRAGTILRVHDLPLCHPVVREFRDPAGALQQRKESTEAVRYDFRGLSADGRSALFGVGFWMPQDFPDRQRSGSGLLWLDPATGGRRWLEFPRDGFTGMGSWQAAQAARGGRVAVAADFRMGKARNRAVWFANPDLAAVQPPMMAGVLGVYRAGGDGSPRKVGVQRPTAAPGAQEAPPPAQPDF